MKKPDYQAPEMDMLMYRPGVSVISTSDAALTFIADDDLNMNPSDDVF